MLAIQTTMTGSWFRPPEIMQALSSGLPFGELPDQYDHLIEVAERRAIRDQLHPGGSPSGLDWVSNGEQRKSGYIQYIPSRFEGFSKKEYASVPLLPEFVQEMRESNPQHLEILESNPLGSFSLPKIETKLEYVGAKKARKEAEAALRIAREEGAKRIFLTAPSPGLVTLWFPNNSVYHDHQEYLFETSKELRKEYESILSVDGIDLQIDSPDLGMGKQRGQWGVDFFDALPSHVEAINEAVKGLPKERIRTHYCFGNWLGSHRFDADFRKVLPEILKLKVGTIVGEMANPRHEGDALILEQFLKQDGEWPNEMKLAMGVIDVKTPILETAETVAIRLERVASLEKVGPDNILAGTDCGFETFAKFGKLTHTVALQKLVALTQGAALASKRLNLE
ncbi:MAG: hypothetical protein ACREBS_07610 [Nitrososphaerales archaeon]